jgi:uncharacterized protein (UPF0335 family)
MIPQEPQESHDEPEDISAKGGKQLGEYIDRIERLKEERKAIGEDIKSVFAEAAACGIDKVALKQLIKDREADLDKTLTLRTVTETYRKALANLQGTLGDWARTWRSNAARRRMDEAKRDYAAPTPHLDEVLRGRKGKGAAGGDDAGREASP